MKIDFYFYFMIWESAKCLAFKLQACKKTMGSRHEITILIHKMLQDYI